MLLEAATFLTQGDDTAVSDKLLPSVANANAVGTVQYTSDAMSSRLLLLAIAFLGGGLRTT